MLFRGRRQAPAETGKPSALDELLSTEQEIAAQMAVAEREAAELAAAATRDADAIEREAAAALDSELAALDARNESSRVELQKKLEDDAARLVARYRSVGDDEVAQHARFALSEVTGFALETIR